MAASPGQDQGAEKNAYFIFWLIALVAIVGFIIWYAFGYQLKQFFIAVKVYELTAVQFFFELFPENLPWIADWVQNCLGEVNAGLNAAKQLTPDNITLEISEILSDTTGVYLRYPIAIYLGLLCLAVFKTNVQKKTQSKMLPGVLYKAFPSFKINFDLSDCDKVLSVEGDDLEALKIMILIKEYGFRCEVLD